MRFPLKTALLCTCFAMIGATDPSPKTNTNSLAPSPQVAAQKHLVVHEWGTFTSLQDEFGRSIGGVNVDDEPVPPFVHRFAAAALTTRNDGSKGFTPAHPDVTMRLETPVMYFYPPDDMPITLDVNATFKGGLLTEFYPEATTTYDGHESANPPTAITSNTQGGLQWHNVIIKHRPTAEQVKMYMVPPPSPPFTDASVWLAPREVKSTPIYVGHETEQYLFYRGVGHFDAPIRVVRSPDGSSLSFYDARPMDRPLPPMKLGGIWLADFHADGSCAFREIADAPASPNAKAKAQSATFADSDYASDNIDKLKSAMKTSLIKDGLFDDEAAAMLETWKLSYFRSNGQRLFFLVPHDWTDGILPLQFSQKCDVTRVMMGRIELITPQQRVAAKQLLDQKHPFKSGELRSKLADSLGRFRDAILNDESKKEAAAATGLGMAN